MKKMGRPSRKTIASTLSFEAPDGETLYFSIDQKGKSNYLGNQKISFLECNAHDLIPTMSIKNKKKAEHSNEKSDSQKNTNKYPKFHIQFNDEKFNLFLEKIENRLNVEDFYKDFKLSNQMILPILA